MSADRRRRAPLLSVHPMWSWVTRPESNDSKRDLVLIGFEADEDEVLVSNFLWWHDVSVSVARARERPESRMSLEELSERRRGIFQPPHAEPFRVVR